MRAWSRISTWGEASGMGLEAEEELLCFQRVKEVWRVCHWD